MTSRRKANHELKLILITFTLILKVISIRMSCVDGISQFIHVLFKWLFRSA